MTLEGFDQALFAELFVGGAVGLGYAVGVESERVTQAKLTFSNFAIPILENTEHGGGGLEALHSVITAEEQGGEMTAIGVTQATRSVVIFGEEQGGESAVGSVVTEELVHGAQETLRLIQSDGALAAQIGLKVGHQESGGDSFSGDVAAHEAETVAAETQEIVIITADFVSLDADTRVFKRFEGRQSLREEPSLDLFRNFKFLGGAAFGFLLVCNGAALLFDSVGHLIETHQRKRISIDIPEAGEHTAPNRRVLCAGRGWVSRMRGAHLHLILEALQARRELEANSALAPFAELGNQIFGDKGDVSGLANELVLFRAGFWRDDGEVRGAVGRGKGYPATTGLNAGVKDQLEAELIEVKAQAAVEIANVDRDRLEAQVRVLAIQANSGAIYQLARRAGHERDYKAGAVKLTLAVGMLPSKGAACCARTNSTG